jgi:beta-N-acetylhexosaminidase
MLKKVLMTASLVLGITLTLPGQTTKNRWVDSVFQSLSLDEKIGQLFMVPVYPKTNRDYLQELENTIKNHQIGGIILMEGGPVQISHLHNRIQQITEVPLLTGVDAGNGLGKNIDSTMIFPSLLALGALRNDTLIYQMGVEIAKQMKSLGICVNFAPSANRTTAGQYDTLERSFGENKENIAEKAVAYMRGLQDNGVIACAKHFPIKGLTILDIKKNGLPVLDAYIDAVEGYPYKKLFANNISGVLTASSEFPLFYEKKKVIKKNKFSPALLTSIYAGEWLRKEMDYHGLVFVSIPDIQDKVGRYKGGDAELLAFEAGNDIILFPEDLGPAIRKIKKLLHKESAYTALLDQKVKKILGVKYDVGLNNTTKIPDENLYETLHPYSALSLRRRLLENTVIVARNDRSILPVKSLEDNKIATLSIGAKTPNPFTQTASKYAGMSHFTVSGDDSESVGKQLASFNTILVALFDDPSLHKDVLNELAGLQSSHNIILVVFGSPLWLSALDQFNTVIEAFTDEAMTGIIPQVVFGALPASGKLPITISRSFQEGKGEVLPDLQRLGYSFPEDVGLDSRVLEKIESIANEAIQIQATPGCYVMVAKNGKVVYERAFGYLTYEKKIPVSGETIYDLASVTKVSATLQTVMFMHDHGMIDVNKKASYYLPELKKSNKKDYTLKDILTHQAGLWPFLPFWVQTMKDSVYIPGYYDTMASTKFPYMVAEKLYAKAGIRDSLWNWIIHARVRDKIPRTPYDYRYSDMGFYILQHLAQKILNQPMQDFLEQNLYEPLGAETTGYLPLRRFPKTRIAPTENDTIFRKQLLIGTVHDQGAALLGGVGGHAGLFSDANDLAKLCQMLLQDGYYGGTRYYRPETVHLFTRKQFDSSRRGLGWDKPVQSDWNSPTSIYASPETFGHTGFTGTCFWIDPEFDLVYVFLSNRVNPIMTNNKLLTVNIRSRIQDVIYQSIFSYCKSHPVDAYDGGAMDYASH